MGYRVIFGEYVIVGKQPDVDLDTGGPKLGEAAARHLNFSRAADELSVTPGAVSQQIQNLEDYIGAALFKRTPKGLLLTDAAQRVIGERRLKTTQALAAETALVSLQRERVAAWIALYRAMGGGWTRAGTATSAQL